MSASGFRNNTRLGLKSCTVRLNSDFNRRSVGHNNSETLDGHPHFTLCLVRRLHFRHFAPGLVESLHDFFKSVLVDVIVVKAHLIACNCHRATSFF